MKTRTIAALGLLATATTLSAAVINVDFNFGSSGNYSGQGAYADPGNNFWNTASGNAPSGTDLTASDGTATTIDFTTNGTGNHARTGYSNLLLRDGTVQTNTITLDGLNDAFTYDLTFYSTFDTFASTFTADGQSAGVSGAANASPFTETFINGMTYVTLAGVHTDGAGGISIAVTNTHTGAGTGTFVTGMQIGEVVPEPSTAVLSLLAGIGLLIRRRS